MHDYAGMLAGLFALLAFIPYVFAILRRMTKPNRASWWIWTAVGGLLIASYRSSGAEATIWVPVSFTVGPLSVALLSLKYGEGGWGPFDSKCLLGAALGVVLWLCLRNPIAGLVVFLFIDFMGALPTLKKAYLEPWTEDKLAWSLWITGNTLNLLAVQRWTFADAAYTLWMFVGSGTIAVLVLTPGRRNRQAST